MDGRWERKKSGGEGRREGGKEWVAVRKERAESGLRRHDVAQRGTR